MSAPCLQRGVGGSTRGGVIASFKHSPPIPLQPQGKRMGQRRRSPSRKGAGDTPGRGAGDMENTSGMLPGPDPGRRWSTGGRDPQRRLQASKAPWAQLRPPWGAHKTGQHSAGDRALPRGRGTRGTGYTGHNMRTGHRGCGTWHKPWGMWHQGHGTWDRGHRTRHMGCAMGDMAPGT